MERPTESENRNQQNLVSKRREKVYRVQKPRAKKAPPPALPIRETVAYPHAKFDVKFATGSKGDGNDKFRPRLGTFTLRRSILLSQAASGTSSHNQGTRVVTREKIEIQTPGMICATRRGMVKHLSRDNVALAKGVQWIHVSLEDFLEHPFPVPAYHPSPRPLHAFLAHPPTCHIVSLSLRDPLDNQNMPANTNAFIQVRTVRGVRKVGIDDWIGWSKALRPDLVWAFLDAPKTLTGVLADANADPEGPEIREIVPGEGRQTSQKRTMKSLDRSWLWVEKLVRGLTDMKSSGTSGQSTDDKDPTLMQPSRPPIIVPLIGGCDPRARAEFAKGLVDKMDLPILDGQGHIIKRVEDGILGYAIELVDLPTNSLNTSPHLGDPSFQDPSPTAESNTVIELIHSSLELVSPEKLRIVHSPPSPHVVLRLISEVGMDLFDVPWLAEAADLGIALDFQFPVPPSPPGSDITTAIGHNLFEERFSMDLRPIGSLESSWPCHPTFSSRHLLHGRLDVEQWEWDSPYGENNVESDAANGFTRAYVHHLLHTHEMSAYALLHLHNLSTMDRFFENIRSFISQNDGAGIESRFMKEIVRFYQRYELPERLFEEARRRWKEVEDARGKGSLKREREAWRNAQRPEEGVPLFAVDDAHPDADMPQSGAVAVLDEALEDEM